MTGASQARDWDAGAYERVSDPQLEWGLEVLDRVELRGDEAVLDAGCGTGRVTRELERRLPGGRVVAADASPSMVDAARAALSDRAEVLVSDLTELTLDEPVDVAFSTAVFHWIKDHDLLFRRLHAALRPGGRLVAQCGGAGNLGSFHGMLGGVGEEEPFARSFAGWEGPWRFAGAEETEAKLAAAGFAGARCWLERKTIHPEEPRDYLRTVCLGHHLERLPADLREPFVEAVAARAPEPLALDYVRLNIDARRAA